MNQQWLSMPDFAQARIPSPTPHTPVDEQQEGSIEAHEQDVLEEVQRHEDLHEGHQGA